MLAWPKTFTILDTIKSFSPPNLARLDLYLYSGVGGSGFRLTCDRNRSLKARVSATTSNMSKDISLWRIYSYARIVPNHSYSL